MKYLNGKRYVQAKDERYLTQPDENIILRETVETKSLATHKKVINETKIGKKSKFI